jgi:broad specificity phosphatase PhoE
MRRLLLVRHGRSAHVHDGSWIDAVGARRFEALYDAAPIRTDEAPPTSVIEAARSADVLIASDLARAITSARALAPDREPVVTPLLREVAFKLPAWSPKLPLGLWDGLYYLRWTAVLFARTETHETKRAAVAADWIESQATDRELTVAITHGDFRRLLSAKLARRGWRLSPGRRRYHNWSAWELTGPETSRNG